jgi:8-oxo-dGTP pyrophosphatase MutT (NUDIX family)
MNTEQTIAVGLIIYSKATDRILYLLRTDKHGEWGLPGGKTEPNETLREAIKRECLEEINWWDENVKLLPIECYNSSTGNFVFHTLMCTVENEFIPILNHEHCAYAWCNIGLWPKPLHRGLFATISHPLVKNKLKLATQTK